MLKTGYAKALTDTLQVSCGSFGVADNISFRGQTKKLI
jgi:hypothetical protein